MSYDTSVINGDFYRITMTVNNEKIFCNNKIHYLTLSLIEKYFLDNYQEMVVVYNLDNRVIDLLVLQREGGDVEKIISKFVYDLSERAKIDMSEVSYKIILVNQEDIAPISRTIHKSFDGWQDYEFSSIRSYLYGDNPRWLNKEPIVNKFMSTQNYFEYLLKD